VDEDVAVALSLDDARWLDREVVEDIALALKRY
jgi:hypothetical protein